MCILIYNPVPVCICSTLSVRFGWTLLHSPHGAATRLLITVLVAYFSTLASEESEVWSPDQMDTVSRPNCTNTDIETSAVDYLTNYSIWVNIGAATGSTVTTNSVSADNRNVNLCYPLSPQLLNCELSRLNITQFRFSPKTHQLWQGNQFRAELGDYFIDDHGDAFYCREIIRPTSAMAKPRCGHVTIEPEDWNQMLTGDNGHLLVSVGNRKDVLVHRRQILYHNGTIDVCYPLSISLLNCDAPYFVAVPLVLYKALPNWRIQYLGDEFDLADYYYLNDSSDVRLCHTAKTYLISQAVNVLIHVFLTVSAIFQILAVVYQYKVPKRSAHSKCIVCHILSYFIFTLCLIFGDYKLQVVNRFTNSVVCVVGFATAYVGSLAAFFWLNSAAFDAWFCFSHMVQTSAAQCQRGTSVAPRHRSRFLYYSIYAWGMPMALCGFLFVLDFSSTLQDLLSIKPQIEVYCWFHDTLSSIAFYYGPMLVITGANIVFFIATVYHIGRASIQTEMVNYQTKKQLFIICVKLFFIMGVSWILEAVMAWSLVQHNPLIFWHASLAIYGLHGIAIFVIIVWKGNSYQFFKKEAKMTYYSLKNVFSRNHVTEETTL